MAKLVRLSDDMSEGEVLMRWLHNRLIRRNKNILAAFIGPTGSGKSYGGMRLAELWYSYHFKKPFPIYSHVCFTITEVVKLISSGKLKRGELIILEEAGTNLGSLDFQNKISKLFTYVLQSFRSLNVGIIFNLPYLSQLNKNARLLLHATFETVEIDMQKKEAKFKVKFRQVNSSTGKVYSKYLRAIQKGKKRVVKRITFSIPSPYIIEAYEHKKFNFIADFTKEFAIQSAELEKDKLLKLGRRSLTATQEETYEYLLNGMTAKEIALKRGIDISAVYYCIAGIRKRGFKVKIPTKPLENRDLGLANPIPTPI